MIVPLLDEDTTLEFPETFPDMDPTSMRFVVWKLHIVVGVVFTQHKLGSFVEEFKHILK